MKRLIILLSVSFLLIMSCVLTTSVGVVFDDTVPEHTSSQLSTSNIGKITSYNGIPVDWKRSATSVIQIPAGETVLIWDIQTFFRNATFHGKDLIVAYNYKPMKKYFFVFGLEDYAYGLKISEFDFDEKITNDSITANYVAFAPFLNLRKTNEKIVLE